MNVIALFYKLERFYQCGVSHGNLIRCGMMKKAANLIDAIINGIGIGFLIKSLCCRLKKLNVFVHHALCGGGIGLNLFCGSNGSF